MSHITVAFDFGPATDSLVEFAAQLSRDLGHDVNLVHVHRLFTENAVVPASFLAEQESLSALQIAAQRIRKITGQDVKTSYSVHYGPVESVILRLSRGSELLLMGQTTSRGVWRYVLGDVTEGVLENANCPVLIVPAGTAFTPPGRIALAVDDKPKLPQQSAYLLRDVCEAYDTKLDVFHREYGSGDSAYEAVRELLSGYSYDYHRDSGAGSLVDYVIESAQEVRANWLTIIHHRRPRWREWLTRNNSEQVAEVAPLPVLILEDYTGVLHSRVSTTGERAKSGPQQPTSTPRVAATN